MASASSSLASLPLEQLSLYHAVDPLLQSSIFVFHGPVTTANSTVSSSRIQAHIISLAGVQSYPRITVSPAAPLYAAVNRLPRDKQGDEVYRGLAVCLLKYFSDLPDTVKEGLVTLTRTGKLAGVKSTRVMFDETHAAEVANKMVKVEDKAVSTEVVRDLRDAFGDRVIPWVDIDIVLPAGSISPPSQATRESIMPFETNSSPERFVDRFGSYSALLESLGDPIFLPTSKLKRAPSQPTNLSRSKIFSAAQKEALRLSMCEVVDTEERYVNKIYDLVHNVAQQFRQKARDKHATSKSPNEVDLGQLFPPCLNDVLEVNKAFLAAIRQVLEDSEKSALSDISGDTPLDASAFPRDPVTGQRQDSMGIIAFAQCLVNWLPQFSQPYVQYLHAHTSFSKVLNSFLGDQTSSFSKRVQETGEQRIRSLLMEPVQRLPRYSLLIDAMTSALPAAHPAVRPLLKARDTVTEICSLDTQSSNNPSRHIKQLQHLIAEWPSVLAPSGRLVTVADTYNLPSPHRIGSSISRTRPGILLVYTDYLILVSRQPNTALTARGLITELDKPQTTDTDGPMSPSLKFLQAIPLSSIRATQSKCDRVIYFLSSQNFARSERSRSKSCLCAVELASTHAGKAGKLIEEIMKARVEGRFPEQFRERGIWSLHSPGGAFGDAKALISVFEDQTPDAATPTTSSTIRVRLKTTESDRQKIPSDSSAEIQVSVSPAGAGRYRMDIESPIGMNSTDTFAASDFLSVLSKRLQNMLRSLQQPQNPLITDLILTSNFNILRIIAEQILGPVKTSYKFRPPSPTKFLANFWGSGQGKESTASAKMLPASSTLSSIPSIPPPSLKQPQQDTTASKSHSKTPSNTAGGISLTDESSSQLKQLEEALSAYILAIQSRRGNIVGRVLRSRDRVDTAAVNELYNTLLENPGRIQAAAEAPVDVLIVAFETFMTKAWKDGLGPLIPAESLQTMQSRFDSMFPGDFADFFRRLLLEMSPQTNRALTSVVKLLAELLEAAGNDGDRGALTDVFSGILAGEGDPRQYISLIDRLVEDCDRLFDDNNAGDYVPLEGKLLNNPGNTPTRARSQTATGSVNSNTSSFRKRFGFGLSRERSKTESGEGKFNSIIRTLSKSKGSATESDTQNQNTFSVPKELLLRPGSVDSDSRLPPVLRPISRDRPLIQTLFSSFDDLHRPNSSHSNASSHASAVEDRAARKGDMPKKKRRSSLSDLHPLSTADVTPRIASSEARRPVTPVTSSIESNNNGTNANNNSRPGTASSRVSPTRRLAPPIDFSRRSPSRTPPPPAFTSPSSLRYSTSVHKENVAKENVAPSPRNTLGERAVNRRSNPPSIVPHSPRKRGNTISQVAPPKSPRLRERNGVLNSPEPLSPVTNSVPASPSKGAKLKMQNPQKLRERIQNEKRALASAESSLQAEIQAIGSEISKSNTSPTKPRPSSSGANVKFSGSMTGSSSTSAAALLNRVRTLENKVTTLISTLGSRTTSLEKDIENSLLVSERRARKLDELYREASAENEALYERFNSELSRVAKEVKMGGGEEMIRTQLKEAVDEVARLTKENLRLKREIAGLRAQQPEIDECVKITP